jgi:hypothetical protein
MNRNRYHAFPRQEGAPYSGELEYLGWRAYGHNNSGRKIVTRDTSGTDKRVDNTTHEHANRTPQNTPPDVTSGTRDTP